MALRPLGALLTAQAQTTWNRLQREGGEASVVAGGLVAVIALLAMAPPIAGSFLFGLDLGRGLAKGSSLATGATAFQALILGVAVLSGLVEHRLAYSLEGFRQFPVPREALLAAELVCGLFNLLTILASACAIALAFGLSAGNPIATPGFLLIALQGLLWIALIQHLVAIGKRIVTGRVVGVVLVVLLPVGLASLIVPTGGQTFLEAVRSIARLSNSLVQVLPFSGAYRGAEDLARGQFAAGLLRQLPLLAGSGLLTAVVAFVHARAVDLEDHGRRSRSERLWSARSRVAALARVFQSLVLGSREGRVFLLMPLVVSGSLAISLTALAEMQTRLASRPWPFSMIDAWSGLPLVGIFLTLLPTMDQAWANQFGWDGPAVRGLFLMPVTPQQILLGRLLGLARIHAIQIAIGIAPLLYERRPSLPEVVWGLAAAGTVFLVVTACGHVVSARFPRRVGGGGFLGAGSTPLTAFLIPPAVQLPTFAVVVLTYKASVPLGPWGPALGLSLLLAATAIGYWRLLPFLGARVMALREILVEELA